MTAEKHTPGPWTVHDWDGQGELVIAVEDSGPGVIEIAAIKAEQPEFVQNAMLLSAAPDLLAAIKALRSDYIHTLQFVTVDEETDTLMALVDAAIAKAEGR